MKIKPQIYSKAQIKRAEKSIVHFNRKTRTKIFFEAKLDKHVHQVHYDRTKPLFLAFSCDCSWCSTYGIKDGKPTKWCYNIIAVVFWLVKWRYLTKEAKEFVYGNGVDIS